MSEALNVIKAAFGGLREVATAPLWQYDYGQILEITGLDLPQAFEVHFSNSRKSGETITQIGTDSQVTIPDMYLTSGADIYCFIFLHDGLTDGETEYVIKIPVRERPEPSDIEPTPEQQDAITEAIAALNVAVTQTGEDKEATAALAEAAAASSLIASEAAQSAQGSATSASSSASTASTAAATATQKASEAATSATNAASAKTAAETAETNAKAAQTASESAQASAESAAQTATSKASEAAQSATSASGSATAASASASAASESATNAAASATAASGSATSAATSATTASTKANEASASATAANTAKTAAQTAKTAAEAAQSAAETAAATFETDTTLTVTGKAADAKATGDAVNDLKEDLTTVVNNTYGENLWPDFRYNNIYISNTNGNEISYNGWSATDFIPVEPGEAYSIGSFVSSGTKYGISSYYAIYNENKEYVSGGTGSKTSISIPQNGYFIRLSFNNSDITNSQKYFFGKQSLIGDWTLEDYRKSTNVYPVSSDVVLVSATGLVYPFTTSSGKFRVEVAEAFTIYYTKKNKTSSVLSIPAGRTYLVTPNNVLIIDGETNTIREVSRFRVKPCDVILLQTGEFVSGFTRYFSGLFANRVTVTTSYENMLLHNVSADYVRNVDDVITHIVNDNPCDFSAIIGTDMHITSQTPYSTNRPILNVINRIQSRIQADAVLNLGDNVNMGKENTAEAYYSTQKAIGEIDDKERAFFVVGNHDYNNISGVSVERQKMEWIIPDEAMFRMYGRLHENDVVWGSKEKIYYYKDFTDKKIRMIVLNTLDKPNDSVTIDGVEYEKYPWLPNIVSSAQVDWFIDDALDFSDKSDKSEWAVIILSHVTPAPNVEWNSASLGDLQNPNPQGAQIVKIAEAFITGTAKTLSYTDTLYGGSATINRNADFTAQGAIPIVGWFSGHNHIDTKTSINGVTYVTTVCGYPDSSIGQSTSMSGMQMIEGTYSAFGVDVMSVDKAARKVKLHRIGIGSDREWTY